MIGDTCITIETQKFPVLDGEEEELVNENMYGKALCIYLEKELPKIGIKVPLFLCEDWGWWLEVIDKDFKMGLCIYSHPDEEDNPERYAVMSSITDEKKWIWSKLRRIDVSDNVQNIMDSIENIFKDDSEINNIMRHDDFPF